MTSETDDNSRGKGNKGTFQGYMTEERQEKHFVFCGSSCSYQKRISYSRTTRGTGRERKIKVKKSASHQLDDCRFFFLSPFFVLKQSKSNEKDFEPQLPGRVQLIEREFHNPWFLLFKSSQFIFPFLCICLLFSLDITWPSEYQDLDKAPFPRMDLKIPFCHWGTLDHSIGLR